MRRGRPSWRPHPAIGACVALHALGSRLHDIRRRAATGRSLETQDLSTLHKALMENMLHGYDVLPSAVQAHARRRRGCRHARRGLDSPPPISIAPDCLGRALTDHGRGPPRTARTRHDRSRHAATRHICHPDRLYCRAPSSGPLKAKPLWAPAAALTDAGGHAHARGVSAPGEMSLMSHPGKWMQVAITSKASSSISTQNAASIVIDSRLDSTPRINVSNPSSHAEPAVCLGPRGGTATWAAHARQQVPRAKRVQFLRAIAWSASLNVGSGGAGAAITVWAGCAAAGAGAACTCLDFVRAGTGGGAGGG